MPQEIYLTRIDLQYNELPIAVEEWMLCEKQIDGIQFKRNTQNILDRVECFCADSNSWNPIFWIDNTGSGSMRQDGFFKYDEIFEKAIEIAAILDALILGEAGSILFEPHVGVLFDFNTDENRMILLDDLVEHKIYQHDHIEYAIKQLIKQKERDISSKTISTHNSKKKHWWKFWA